MDFVTFLRVLQRRWVVVLAGLIITLIVIVAVGKSVGPTYEARGSVLLVGPAIDVSSERGPFPANPYLYMNPSVHSTAIVIAERMSSDEMVRELADVGATADYEVTSAEKTPILTVTARGASEVQVLHTARLVLQRMGDELVARQQAAGAPAHTLIRSQILSGPRASLHEGSKLRVMAAVSVLGLGMTLLFVLAVESLDARRGRLRQLEMPLPAPGPVPAGTTSPISSSSPTQAAATSTAAPGNGLPLRPPSGPLVEVLVPTVKPQRAEEHSGGSTVEEEADSADLEQHDRVHSWWSAWALRQPGRLGTRDEQREQLRTIAAAPAADRSESAEETHKEQAGTSNMPPERGEQMSSKGEERQV